MTPDAILGAVADFKNCIERMWPDAARRGISRASFDRFTARPRARRQDHGLRRRAAGVHQGVLGLSRSAGHRRAHRQGPRNAGRSMPRRFDAVEQAYGVDRHIIAAIWGVETKYGTVGGRPAGDPLDRDARLRRPAAGLFQATSFSRHWKFCIAATSSPSSSKARGPARSARPNSCRRRSSAMRSTSTATVGATSSIRSPT